MPGFSPAHLITSGQQAFFSVCGPIEVDEKDLVCVRIDEQIDFLFLSPYAIVKRGREARESTYELVYCSDK